jgi:hypothetical protein
MIRHIALFKLRPGFTVESPRVVLAESLTARMGDEVKWLRDWTFGRNLSDRPEAYDFAAVGLLDDERALERYLADPLHARAARAWRAVSDRVVADVREDLGEAFLLTDAERALLPTDEDVAFYEEHGWYLSGKLRSDDEVDLLASASERFYAGHRDRVLPGTPPRLAYWTPEKGDVQRHNDYIHYESDEIASVLRKPLLGAVAARLAGASEIRVFQSTLIYKPPVEGEPSNVVPWHFDRDYWATSTSERMLTAFIPFHDCDTRMGTITMIDGSHRWRELSADHVTARHFVELGGDMEAALQRKAVFNDTSVRKVPMNIPKGHVSFHHCRTYHGSGGNRSEQPRRALSLHLQDGDNAYREFTLPDGSTAAYNHDVLVRRTPAGLPDYADPDFCPTLWREGI